MHIVKCSTKRRENAKYKKLILEADKGEKVKGNIEKQMKAWYNKDKKNIRVAISVCWERGVLMFL